MRAGLLPLLAGTAALLAAACDVRTVVFEEGTSSDRVRVMERSDGLRELYMGEGRVRQSAVYPGRPLHLELPYTRVATLSLALVPPGGRILYVGLGGGALPMHARQLLPELRIDVVEIDPRIVEVARDHFGFVEDPRTTVHVADGRAFIEAAPVASWDVVLLDAFADDAIPRELATRQFLEEVRRVLARGGAVVANVPSGNPLADDMLATYAAVFPGVARVQVPGRQQWIVVAVPDDRPLGRQLLVEAGRRLAPGTPLGFDLPSLVEEGFVDDPLPAAPVLEDAPVP